MKKFEYKTFQTKLTDTDLNKLGLEGWEMVTHTAVAVTNGREIINNQYYVFKRQINE